MHRHLVEHAYEQLRHRYDEPNLRDIISDVTAANMAYLDDHAEHQRWVDEATGSQSPG